MTIFCRQSVRAGDLQAVINEGCTDVQIEWIDSTQLIQPMGVLEARVFNLDKHFIVVQYRDGDSVYHEDTMLEIGFHTPPVSQYAPRHLDYAGMTMYSPDIGTPVEIRHARAQICDMCDPGDPDYPKNCAAEYVVDAESVLGVAGNNAYYCEEHLLAAMHYGLDAGETWATAEGTNIMSTAWLGRRYI